MIMTGTGKSLMVLSGFPPRLGPLPPSPICLLCAGHGPWQTQEKIVVLDKAKRTAVCRCVMGMLTGDLKSSGRKKEDFDKLWTKVTECVYLAQAGGDDTKASERENTNWGGCKRSGKTVCKADPTGEATMEELIADLESRGMKKEDIDEMWKEVSKRECEENWFYQAEQMAMEEEAAAEFAMADKWQEWMWGTDSPWDPSSVPSDGDT